MRLSIFSFPDLVVSYGILQFEVGEDPSARILAMSEEELKGVVESALSSKAVAVSVASGVHVYRGTQLKLTYLRVELEDGREFSLELYGESARTYSNTNAEEHYQAIVSLMKAIVPELRLPRSRLVGV
uniref:DUF1795 domain-containing protein n=1 Tax=Thermofilum pendens TaxID=2269 RepID=A0A7J3X8L2_THEPE